MFLLTKKELFYSIRKGSRTHYGIPDNYEMDKKVEYDLKPENGFFYRKLKPKFFDLGFTWTETDERFALLTYKETEGKTLENMLKEASTPSEYGSMSPLLSLTVGAVHSPAGVDGSFSLIEGLQYPTWRGFLIETVDCPLAVLMRATLDETQSVRISLASLDGIPELIQKVLAFDSNVKVREALIANESVSETWRVVAALN